MIIIQVLILLYLIYCAIRVKKITEETNRRNRCLVEMEKKYIKMAYSLRQLVDNAHRGNIEAVEFYNEQISQLRQEFMNITL